MKNQDAFPGKSTVPTGEWNRNITPAGTVRDQGGYGAPPNDKAPTGATSRPFGEKAK